MYTINGETQDFPSPIDSNGTTYVPMAKIVEAMGGYVTWNPSAGVASIELGDKRADVQAENPNINVAGQTVTLSSPPINNSGTIWVPLDFFTEVLACTVNQDSNGVQVQAV